MISYLKNTEGYKMEFFKGKTYDQILPIFQARFDANLKFLFKSREEMEKEDEEIIKSINETPAQKASKRRKLSEEAQEADDLKKRLEIVQDKDDDSNIDAARLKVKLFKMLLLLLMRKFKTRLSSTPAYTNRFQELALICTKFVSNETEKVDKYISGLPDNIYGNVKSSKPKTLDETIELANDLMDQKLRTYAKRKSNSKRKADDISRNNHGGGGSSSRASGGNQMTMLLSQWKEHKKARSYPLLSSEYKRYVHSDFVTHLQTTEFTTFDVLAPVDCEEEILDADVQANEAIPLSDEEIALDAASREGSMSGPGSGGKEAEANYGPVAYRLNLPEELNGVHDTFHVLNLKKCLANPTLQAPLDEIRVDAKLNFMEEPVEILQRELNKLKRSRISIVKVRWNSKRGPEFTWEREDR
nr:reverse transcriptase domain-containing protein [Tanacetum cinerariifolium]